MPIPFISRSLSSSFRSKNPSFPFTTLAVTNPVEKYWTYLQSNDPNIEKSLTRIGAELDASCVKEVITRCSSTNQRPILGLRFFIWAGIQREYRHTSDMYNIACNLFRINQNPNVIRDVIEAYTVDISVVNVKTFKVLLNLCKEAKLADESLWVLKNMNNFNCKPDTLLYNFVIKLLCEQGKVDEASRLIEEMSSIHLYPDMPTFVTTVKAFCDLGRIEDASRLFKIVNQHGCTPNVIAYSTLLDGMCRIGNLEKALKLLEEMENKGGICTPTVVTYTSMIRSFCDKGKSVEAFTFLDRIEARGRTLNRVTIRTFINGLCNDNQVDEAYKLIDRVVDQGSVSKGECYSTLVVALYRIGKSDDAEKLLKKMLISGLKPDGVASNTALRRLCSKEERVLDAFVLYNEIEKLGFATSIDSEIYSIMLNGLCMKRCLLEASKLAKLMVSKSIRIEGHYVESVVEYLNNAGEMELASLICKVNDQFGGLFGLECENESLDSAGDRVKSFAT